MDNKSNYKFLLSDLSTLNGVGVKTTNLLKKKGITASEFSKIIDVQRSSISHIINGRNKPSLEIVTKVCRIYPDISLEWLIYGNENKHNPVPLKESEKKKTKNEIDVETLTSKFISNWNSCDSNIVIDNNENLPESKILRLNNMR